MLKSLTRDEIREKIIDTPLGDFRGEDFELALDYYLDNREDKKIENLYKKVIEENAKNLYEELRSFNNGEVEVEDTIINLVSFLSLAPLNQDKILTESPILKTLRAIPTIENIFVLYTKDSEKRFKELKEYLKNEKKEVIGKSIDIDNINESYTYLQALVKSGEISGEDTIMDSTLGLRMFGIALYKIAVERGINIIAWRDYQLPSYMKFEDVYLVNEKATKRIPFLTKLALMQEPKFENAKIYRALIEELKKFNFSGASSYYNTLGLRDLKRICEDLEEIFNLKNILEFDVDKFYFTLENVLKRILDYDFEEEKNKEIVKPIILDFLSIVDYKKLIKNINTFNIKKTDIDDYMEKATKEDKNIKEKIYYFFVLIYLKVKLGEEAIDNTIIKNIVKRILKWDKNIKEFETIDDILEVLFSDSETGRKIEEIFNIADSLVEDVEYPIEWNGRILKIAKYNLNIDLYEEEKSRGVSYIFTSKSTVEKLKNNTIANPIIRLFTNTADKLDKWEIERIYNENKIQKKSTLSKNKSNLRNIAKFINEIINLKLKELGKEEKDFIIIEDNSEDSNKSKKSLEKIYINDFFQDMRK